MRKPKKQNTKPQMPPHQEIAVIAKAEPSKKPARQERKFTLEQAFDYFYTPREANGDPREDSLNLERGLRAIAFIIHWQTEIGNEPLDGNMANGFAYLLESMAGKIEFSHESFARRFAEASHG